MKQDTVVVIGAGASGLLAAWKAATRGKKVLLLEKMHQPGLKLRITGKGRCNLTNVSDLRDFLAHCGSEPRFLYPALQRFFHKELMCFFEEHGVPLIVERGKRVFPKSGKSIDVFLALVRAVEATKTEIHTNTSVSEILVQDKCIQGVRLQDGKIIKCNKIILAAGGQSYPRTGSCGDGVLLAQNVGHRIVPCYPSLVGFEVEEYLPEYLSGFILKNIEASISVAKTGKKIASEFGELMFSGQGIEGPVMLTLSRKISALASHTPLCLSIDFKPALDETIWDEKCIKDCISYSGQPVFELLRHWVPKPIAMYLTGRLPESIATKSAEKINAGERKFLKKIIKHLDFHLSKNLGWERAIVTQGGTDLKEIVPQTMESKLIHGLYFAGEVMDLDADTGGYNLQIAFSTGYLAGTSV